MRHDAIVVGGSFAGLSAATYLARGRRSVCIVDSGAPRNRFAAHAHGFLAQDGQPPGAILTTARAQVAAYPTVTFVEGRAVGAARDGDGFTVTLATGEVLEGRRVVLAFGLTDELPRLPGLAERWGSTVIHCPYCHGYEFSGRRLGVLNLSELSLHQALLISEWGPTTFFLNGAPLDEAALAPLRERGIALEPAPIRALHGEGTHLAALELADGREAPIDALYIAPRTRLNSGLAEELGCELEDGPFGLIVRTDELKQTTTSGVFAAGDITRAMHSVTFATADGVMAGVAAHRSLIV